MLTEVIEIKKARLEIYARDNLPEMDLERRYPTVVICPGGGYSWCSDREGEPVALAFVAAGFTAAVLRYGCKEEQRHPTQLHQISAAIAFLRDNAEKYHVDEERVFSCGFSAGGHLAAMIGTLWPETPEGVRARPTGMILCYSVLSSIPEAIHRGSFNNLCGEKSKLWEELSLETRVDENTVPAFLWHTADDSGVPALNSILMAQALAKAKIPYELHIFPHGTHGLALATNATFTERYPRVVNPTCAQWFQLAVDWTESEGVLAFSKQ